MSGDADGSDTTTDSPDATTDGGAAAGSDGGVGALLSGVRIGQFVSVGVAGATLETAIVALLTTLAAAAPLAAKAVGAEASITLMFLLNDRYTFGGEGAAGGAALLRRWGKSHLVRLGGLAVAFTTLWLLTSRTDVSLLVAGRDLWPTVANLIGIGVGLTLNYVAESLFTWRVLE
ncbi:GtrA family protein [Halobaculum sp. WSA2]|uniref:GtrA family protein n=1 Tax=Halobaculum saliterrae TaxID=2073113 RepID=A0A6B0ST79_9EURY|nr:GtrA family protein [Halobaculum saliterrae]MXR41767.1 GtrA family protein [Halobaculum saliterrae]